MSADDAMCEQPCGPPPPPEDEEVMVEHAIYCLGEARRLRADANLMAKVRARIRDQRDQLAGLLDEI